MIKYLLTILLVFLLIGAVSAETARITAQVVASSENESLSIREASEENQMVGNDRDSHGCIGSAGYSWCEEKSKCLRIWEENCTSITERLNNEVQTQKIYILPEMAAQRAIEAHNARCSLDNCTVIIKEILFKNANITVYGFNLKKQVKILGFITSNMEFKSYINAETGELVSTKKPWWSKISSE